MVKITNSWADVDQVSLGLDKNYGFLLLTNYFRLGTFFFESVSIHSYVCHLLYNVYVQKPTPLGSTRLLIIKPRLYPFLFLIEMNNGRFWPVYTSNYNRDRESFSLLYERYWCIIWPSLWSLFIWCTLYYSTLAWPLTLKSDQIKFIFFSQNLF